MKNPQDLRVIRTKRLLSKALISLMKKKPFEKISITDICDAAMIHRTTFYAHYDDKYDLLLYITKEIEKEFENVGSPSLSGGIREYYLSVASNILGFINENMELLKTLIVKNKQETFVSRFRAAAVSRFEEKLARCVENGAELEAPASFLANFYIGGCMDAIVWWIENDTPFSSDELLRYIKTVTPRLEKHTSARGSSF